MNKLLTSFVIATACTVAVAQCPQGTSYGSGDDFVANGGNGIALGFAFPIGAASYTHIHPVSNGYAWLSDGSAAITDWDYIPDDNEWATLGPRVAPFWDDLNLVAGNGGELFVETSPAACTVTWYNAVNFGQTTIFSMSMTLYSSGQIDFNYNGAVYNQSPTYVGVAPGAYAAVTPFVDLSGLLPTTDDMTWENFAANTFDLASQTLSLFPLNPGYLPLATPYTPPAVCASKQTYGEGCMIAAGEAAYELFPLGTFDLTGSMTVLRTGNAYSMLNGVGGTYVAPTANAVVVSANDDQVVTVGLSVPMPRPGGTTNSLTISTNGWVSMSGTAPHTNDYSPTVAEFEGFTQPTICGPWYDWSPNAGGQLLFEEAGGIAYVTWDNVPAYQTTVGDTVQYQFNLATGDCTVVWNVLNLAGASAWHTPLVGYTSGVANLPVVATSHDMSVDLPALIAVNDPVLPLTIDSNSPRLGANWDVTTSNIDPLSPITVTFFGDAAVDPGLPVAVIGWNAPGCSFYINTVLANATGINIGGSSVVTIPIPNQPSLTSATLSAQSICLTISNPLNLLFSNGVIGTLGG